MRIKEILKEKGMTSKELAAKIGISEGALSQQIREGANPTLQALERIATGLGCSVAELFEQPKTGYVACPRCGSTLRITIEEFTPNK